MFCHKCGKAIPASILSRPGYGARAEFPRRAAPVLPDADLRVVPPVADGAPGRLYHDSG
jgi:hypothetical protein